MEVIGSKTKVIVVTSREDFPQAGGGGGGGEFVYLNLDF